MGCEPQQQQQPSERVFLVNKAFVVSPMNFYSSGRGTNSPHKSCPEPAPCEMLLLPWFGGGFYSRSYEFNS
jgi:hypothetical protein